MAAPPKTVSVFLKTADIIKDPVFFPIPGQSPSLEAVQKVLALRYRTDKGKLALHVDRDRAVIQWKPDYVDTNAESIHQEALRLARSRQFEQAIGKWKQAIAIHGQDVEYHYHLGLVYFELKQYFEAIESLEKAAAICPIHHKAHLALGINFIKIRKFDQAESHVLECIRLHSVNGLAYLNLGAIYSVQKKYNEAIAIFNRTIQLSPRESRAFLGLARVYVLLNDVEAANAHFRKVIELVPNSPLAEFAKKSIVATRTETIYRVAPENQIEKLTKGMGYFMDGQNRQAAEQYKEYLSNQPSDDYAWYLLGETQMRTQHMMEAVDCFHKAIRLNGKRGLYYKALGTAFYIQGRTEESLEALKKAMDFGKKDALTLTMTAINHIRANQREEAAPFFRIALKRNPSNPLAMFHYGELLLSMNEKSKAIALLNKVIKLEYFAPVKEQAKRLVGSTI